LTQRKNTKMLCELQSRIATHETASQNQV